MDSNHLRGQHGLSKTFGPDLLEHLHRDLECFASVPERPCGLRSAYLADDASREIQVFYTRRLGKRPTCIILQFRLAGKLLQRRSQFECLQGLFLRGRLLFPTTFAFRLVVFIPGDWLLTLRLGK